jgi:hypothetical protein
VTGCFRWRIQPVDATVWLNISAGVWKPRVFLGRSFNCLATAFSLASMSDKTWASGVHEFYGTPFRAD